MTIKYDKDHKLATHVESGLSVQFYRRHQDPREKEEFYKLYWRGEENIFSAEYIYENKTDMELDKSNIFEYLMEISKTRSKSYVVSSIGSVCDDLISEEKHDLPQIFVELIHRVVSENLSEGWSVSVSFVPFGNDSLIWGNQNEQ